MKALKREVVEDNGEVRRAQEAVSVGAVEMGRG